MVIFPNAKINLGLRIVSKREDGFHDLQTCFIPIPYYDILEIIPATEDSLEVYNYEDHADNILLRARDQLREKKNFGPVSMFLYKNIPTGAGLGGGSADAAFLLKGLNNLFELELSETELMEVAGEVGKDCPFFIINRPIYATGTGDIFSPISIDLSGHYLAVITPSISISTKNSFSEISPKEPEQALSEILIQNKIDNWKGKVINDFQGDIENEFSEISDARKILDSAGSLFSSLSGTGSSVYGIFKEQPQLISIHDDWRVWLGKI